MISVCFSNDVNVIADKSLSVMNVNKDKKSKLTKRTLNAVTKTVTIKRDLSGVYVDVKAKMNDDSVCAKHNVSVNTLAAVKAWITMGK
jgi:transcription antitermination factor NusG